LLSERLHKPSRFAEWLGYFLSPEGITENSDPNKNLIASSLPNAFHYCDR